MHIEAFADQIQIKAPAKVNLFLEILGKREDGFHEIDTIMCPIQLFDKLTVKKATSPDITLQVKTPQSLPGSADDSLAWGVPESQDNLVARAAKLVQHHSSDKFGFDILLEKQIPAAAGLGGGSSDAAAAIVATMLLNDGWNRKLATDICSQLGSDIPFFLGSEEGIGLMRSTGRGEVCTLIAGQPSIYLLVTHPPEGCSTAKIYQQFQPLQTVRDSEKIMAACETGQTPKIGAELFNALQFAASELNQWIKLQLEFYSSLGLNEQLMSGSGSSCFAFVPSDANVESIREQALQAGIPRAYFCRSWFAPSIEQQIITVHR